MIDIELLRRLVHKREHDADFERKTESDIRSEYIDPLFRALGWDPANLDETSQDVWTREVHGINGRVDYVIKIGDRPQFVIEAKRAGGVISMGERQRRLDRTSEERQVLRYTRERRIPWAILTNFDRLLVFDADAERLLIGFDSPSAMLSSIEEDGDPAGSLRQLSYAAVTGGSLEWLRDLALKSEMDRAFLGLLRELRLLFARDLLRNHSDSELLQSDDGALSLDKVLAVVQRVLDRLILIRYADDHEILRNHDLLATLLRQYEALGEYRGPDELHASLVRLWAAVDRIHDTTIFQQGHPCERLWLSNDVLAHGIEALNGVSFRKFTFDVLGATYESYLGTTLVFENGNLVEHTEPEKRRWAGIYYTPRAIVEELVDQTLGTKLKELREQFGLNAIEEVRELRVLDPACGSGSFLIHAYDQLADFYRDLNDQIDRAIDDRTRGIDDHIEQLERIRDLPRKVTDYPWVILTEHLYGVDIDGEAAEIATLNLVMRAFRELRSLGRHEEKLPLILNQNIKVGNSLVPVVNASLEEYALARQTHLTRLMTMRRQIAESRDEEEQRRVVSEFEYLVRALPQNLLERFGVEGADALPTFDWFGEFPEVWFQADGSPRLHPGFDVVVGNPPYIRIQRLRQAFPVEADIYRRLYQSARGGSYDIYVLFVERGLSLLSRAGRLGYIMPSRFFKAEYGAAGRKLIADRQHVEAIVDFGANQVFAGATTYTALLFLTASEAASYRYCRVRDLEMWRATRGGRVEVLDSATLSGKPWVFALGPGGELFRRLDAWSPKFGDAADLFVGVQTSADAVFILEYLDSSQDYVRLRSKSLQADVEMERAAVRPIVSGEDVGRYEELSAKHWVLFPYDVENEVPALIPIDEIHARWPLAGRYLDLNRATLESRERGAFRDANWHRFGRNQNIGIQFRPKLCVPRLVVRLGAALDRNGAFVLDNVDVGGLTLKAAFADHSPEYVVALLNSSLLNQQFRHVTIPYRGEWLSANRQFIDPLPFRPIKFADPQEAVLHDQIVELVHEIIANRARLRELVLEPADELTSRVAELESAVDEIVEALFDLTVEEKSVLHPPRDGLR